MKILGMSVVFAPQNISFIGSKGTLAQRMNADKSVCTKNEEMMEKIFTDGARGLAVYIDGYQSNDFKDTIQRRIGSSTKLGSTGMI
jgi:hypothetical protein